LKKGEIQKALKITDSLKKLCGKLDRELYRCLINYYGNKKEFDKMKIWFTEFMSHSDFLELHDYLKVFDFYRIAGEFASTKMIIEVMREKKVKTVGETCNQILQNIAQINNDVVNVEQIEAVHSVFDYMIQLQVDPTPTTVSALELFSRYCDDKEQNFWQLRLSMFEKRQPSVKKNPLQEYLEHREYETQEKVPNINFDAALSFKRGAVDARRLENAFSQQIFFNSKGLMDENGIPLEETIESDIRQIQEISSYFEEAPKQRMQNMRRERNF